MCEITKENDSLQRQTENKDENSQKIQGNKNIPELRFPEFEGEWIRNTLNKVIISFINGKTPSRDNNQYWDGDIPWVSSGELNYNHITQTNEKITEDGQNSANLQLLPKNTFLIAVTGLEASGTRGSCAILDIEATTNQSCMALIPNPKKLAMLFLYYWYLKKGEKYGIKYTQGTKQQSYNIEILKKLPITIPLYIEEQEKIANFLSAIDKKIGFMEKKHTLYQNIKKYYLENLFPKENETIPNLRFLEFNNDWIKTTLGNCVIFLDEKRIPLNQQIRSQMLSKYPYYGAAGIIDYVNNYIFDDELILLGEDGSIIPTLASGKCWVSNHAHVLKNKKNINLYFLYNILSKIHFEKYNTGTIQPKLNKKTAKNIKIKITSKKEQEKIVDFMLSIGTKIKKNSKTDKISKNVQKRIITENVLLNKHLLK